MANIDDERRRRAGVRLTPEQEDWIARAMDAQSKGLPVPPRPTEMGEGGMQRLSPAYTDPRSQSIANSPIRPVRSMLDRIFSPGRADAVNQMNREYKENALTSQLGRSGQRIEQDYNKARTESLMTSNKMEKLKELAMSGDAEALKLLKAYTAAIGKGGGLDYGILTGGQGPGDTKVVRKAGASGGVSEPSITGIRGNLTPSENRASLEEQLAAAKENFNRLEKIELEGGAVTDSWEMMGTGNVENFPKFKKFTEGELVEVSTEKAATEKEIQNLEHTVKSYRRPLTSPSGGPTHYINQ